MHAQAPKITASASGHFVDYAGQTLMLVGESGTQCVTQNANLDYRQWIDDCAARGIRFVHVWSFAPLRQHQDGSKLEERWGYVYPGLTPWARNSDGPLAADQLPQWDLKRFDDGSDNDLRRYWPRLRDLCRYAQEKHIVVGITAFTGWAKHNEDWTYHPLNARNGGYLKNVGDAVRIEVPGQEIVDAAWSDAWSDARKTQWVWERLAKKYIDDLNALGNVLFVFLDEHSYDEGNLGDHFLAFFKQRGAVWVDWRKRQRDVAFAMSDTINDIDKNADALRGFGAQPARPYLLLEGPPYRGPELRESIWTFSVGGGHYTFHADYEQETPTTGIMGYDPNVPGGDTGMEKRDWLGHASRFFNEHVKSLDTLAPHNELVTGSSYCLADPDNEYIVYLKRGEFRPVRVAVGSVATARFYNPRTGEFLAPFTVTATSDIAKPDDEDWVLHLIGTE